MSIIDSRTASITGTGPGIQQEKRLVVGSGILILIFGILIKYFGWIHLIAGYDSERIDDEDGLANFVVTNTLIIAVLTLLVGMVDDVAPANSNDWYWFAFALTLVGITARLLRGTRRYESD